MCGIGDWITGVLEKDGAPVASVVPKEGGIQWTESYCIGKGSEKADIVKKFIQYMLSPEGQVKSAQMAAYPGFCITKGGRKLLNEVDAEGSQAHGSDRRHGERSDHLGQGRPDSLPEHSGPAGSGGLERLLVRVQERLGSTRRVDPDS